MATKSTKKCTGIINTKFRRVLNFWGPRGNVIGTRFLGASVVLIPL